MGPARSRTAKVSPPSRMFSPANAPIGGTAVSLGYTLSRPLTHTARRDCRRCVRVGACRCAPRAAAALPSPFGPQPAASWRVRRMGCGRGRATGRRHVRHRDGALPRLVPCRSRSHVVVRPRGQRGFSAVGRGGPSALVVVGLDAELGGLERDGARRAVAGADAVHRGDEPRPDLGLRVPGVRARVPRVRTSVPRS